MKYFALSYDDIQPPTVQEANAYFDDGSTLIISTVSQSQTILWQSERQKCPSGCIAHGR